MGGEWTRLTYTNSVDGSEHLVLLKGSIRPEKPTLVRIHWLRILDDALGGVQSGGTGSLRTAMECIGREECGVIVVLSKLRPATLVEDAAHVAKNETPCREPIDYNLGAQILLDLGVRDIILLSDSESLPTELGVYGLRITEQRSLFCEQRG